MTIVPSVSILEKEKLFLQTVGLHRAFVLNTQIIESWKLLQKSNKGSYFYFHKSLLNFILCFKNNKNELFFCNFRIDPKKESIQYLNNCKPFDNPIVNPERELFLDKENYRKYFDSIESMMKTVFSEDFKPIDRSNIYWN